MIPPWRRLSDPMDPMDLLDPWVSHGRTMDTIRQRSGVGTTRWVPDQILAALETESYTTRIMH